MKREAAPPSRVVHIRNLAPDVNEAEVVSLGVPFGTITKVLCIRNKGQVSGLLKQKYLYLYCFFIIMRDRLSSKGWMATWRWGLPLTQTDLSPGTHCHLLLGLRLGYPLHSGRTECVLPSQLFYKAVVVKCFAQGHRIRTHTLLLLTTQELGSGKLDHFEWYITKTTHTCLWMIAHQI